jgi:type III restriction enzyme
MNKIDFQTEAQEKLVDRAVKLIGRHGRSVITLQSPTGSGKTVMMANALSALTEACEGAHSLAILWVAPNKLHEQSYSRLQQVYAATKTLTCLKTDELAGGEIPERTVVFMNWGSIDSESLLLRRDNETRRNLASYVQRARAVGRKVVLVVDESHLHLDSGEQAQVVVDHIIQPDLLIEVSATPRVERPDAPIVVLREDVIAAGLIRKGLTVNPGAQLTESDGRYLPTFDGTSESLLDAALAKQADLTRQYLAAGSPVVPLVLVQLPDRRANADALEHFENYLFMKHGLERGNGVAVWLSGDRSPELDAISEFGSPVRVMFFKQAAATGWDCPRAQILVGLREMQSDTFTTQVLGRIIRQPEHQHYVDEDLNRGYVFTNYPKLELDAETVSWVDKAWVRAKEPLVLPLPNWVAKNADGRTHLTLDVVSAILAHRDMLESVRHLGAVSVRLLDGDVIDDIDAKRSIEGSRSVNLDVYALQAQLDKVKADLVSSTAAQIGGRKYVEKALRDAAAMVVGTDDETVVLETILHPLNKQQFLVMAQRGIHDFLVGKTTSERVLELRSFWEAPLSRFMDVSAPLEGYTKCLYQPVLAGQFQKSDVEKPFSKLLDSDPDVEMWLKNGDNGREHFAIRYEMDGQEALFYPDFIVKTLTGGIRLYDTKGSGDSERSTGNAVDTHAKARALAVYMQELRDAGLDVEGGIVVRKDRAWWVHSGESYSGTVEVSEQFGWRAFML